MVDGDRLEAELIAAIKADDGASGFPTFEAALAAVADALGSAFECVATEYRDEHQHWARDLWVDVVRRVSPWTVPLGERRRVTELVELGREQA